MKSTEPLVRDQLYPRLTVTLVRGISWSGFVVTSPAVLSASQPWHPGLSSFLCLGVLGHPWFSSSLEAGYIACSHYWMGFPFSPSFVLSWRFFFFFWCGPFLKSLLSLLEYCFCSEFWFFDHKAFGIWNPRPGIEPPPPCIGRWRLNHRLPGKCPVLFVCVPGNFIQYQICIRTIMEALGRVNFLQKGLTLSSGRQLRQADYLNSIRDWDDTKLDLDF